MTDHLDPELERLVDLTLRAERLSERARMLVSQTAHRVADVLGSEEVQIEAAGDRRIVLSRVPVFARSGLARRQVGHALAVAHLHRLNGAARSLLDPSEGWKPHTVRAVVLDPGFDGRRLWARVSGWTQPLLEPDGYSRRLFLQVAGDLLRRHQELTDRLLDSLALTPATEPLPEVRSAD
jgi:hypothetical protein